MPPPHVILNWVVQHLDKPVGNSVATNTVSWNEYIELIVDGDIVDLNRILLPADTPIIDKRFEERTMPQ